MQTFRLFLFLLAGIIAGYNTHSFLSRNHVPALPKEKVSASKEQKAISAEVAQHYQHRIDSLEQTSTALGRRVASTRADLQQAKRNAVVLTQLVDTLVAHQQAATDTAAKIADCDSLGQMVTGMKSLVAHKDSLYDGLVCDLERQVDNKDSTLNMQRQAYQALQLSFDNNLAQQDLLSAQNTLLQKQLHQQIVKSKVLSISALVLTGIATYSLIRH